MVTSAISADLKQVPIIIGGKHQASNGKTAVQSNPATGEGVALIPYCTNEEISAAVEAAQKAFKSKDSDKVVLEVKGTGSFGYLEFRDSLYGPPLDIAQ